MDSNQNIASVLALLQQGGGGDQPQRTPSGLPYVPALSGLFNLQGVSGNGDPSMSGSSARGSLGPGNQGGPSLAELNLMNAESGADTSGGVNLGSLLSGISGNIGQQNIGGQGFVAGNTTPGPGGSQATQGYTAGQTGNNTADPLSLLAKLFPGLVKAGIGLASPLVNSSPAVGLTESDISGTTPEAQAAFQQQRAGERTASPYVTPSVDLSSYAGIPIDQITAGLGFEPSALGTFGVPGGETAANLAGVGAAIGTGASYAGSGSVGGSQTGTPAGTPNSLSGEGNTFGALSGGLGAGTGLLGILQALQSGNVGAGIQGGVGTLKGLSQLISSVPDLANIPGLSEISGLGALLGAGGSIPASVGSLGEFTPDIASGAGLGGSILGALGGLTGSKGLDELGQAIGSLSQIPALTAAAAGETIGSLAAGGSSAASAAVEALPALASVSAAAIPAVGAAIAMLTALGTDLAAGQPAPQVVLDTLSAPDFIASGIVKNVIDPLFHPSEAWMTFPQRVGETAGLEGRSLQALMQGLPYVQSQQELADAIAAFKGQVGSQVGGYGQGSGPLDIPGLSEIGSKTHGFNTNPTDFAAITPEVQRAIQALNPLLPATFQEAPGVDPLMRDFTQFLNPRGTGDYAGAAPIEYFSDPSIVALAQQYPQQFSGGLYIPTPTGAEGQWGAQYGDPNYNYQAAGFPEPGQHFGSVSPYWQQLIGGGGGAAQAPASSALAPAPQMDPAMMQSVLALLQSQAGAAPTLGGSALAPAFGPRAMFAASGGGDPNALLTNPLLAAYGLA